MGVVWRARDTRLDRDVALKILPREVANDAGRLARFHREARILASLQHPNIASIFGFEQDAIEDERFLVMEMVEGEDLAQILQRGPIPMFDALDIARQMATGIEAAHEQGIVHRDLKPANVKRTPDGRVKVLDFGLAKAYADESAAGAADSSHSPTLTAAATRAGVILGTAAYMSPEQARGRPVDKRADIWAFGCVLYEMLTATRSFAAGTVSDTLASVLRSEPDWLLLPSSASTRVIELLKRCLRKDPNERLRDIGDARIELTEATSDSSDALAGSITTPHRGRRWSWAAVGILAGALVATVAFLYFRSAPPAPQSHRFAIPIPELGVGWGRSARISPDGNLIAYFSGRRLWVRDLRRFDSLEIPGSENAFSQFWSPDSSQLGFEKEGQIRTFALGTGQSTSACRIPDSETTNHMAWGADGRIYFALFRGGLYEVPAAGGEPRLLLAPGPDEEDFHNPDMLPDGAHLVMVAHRLQGPHPVVVVSLADGKRTTLTGFNGLGSVKHSRSGHLLLNFIAGRQRFLAAPFSDSTLQLTGDPFLVATGGQFPSVSATGTLIYYLGSSAVQRELIWVDREGRAGQVVGRPRIGLNGPAISPDGRRVAVMAYENENADVWVQDLARGIWSRLASGPQEEGSPVWSPSGDRIYYLQLEDNIFYTLMEIPSDGSGAPRRRVEMIHDPPITASPDGRTLGFVLEKKGRLGLWQTDLNGGTEMIQITTDSSASEWEPAISPDGRWIAYASDESGQDEVFVRRFPDGGEKQQVSLEGGLSPRWSPRGEALFYLNGPVLMEVAVQNGSSLTFGTYRRLFSVAEAGLEPSFDIAADGRFLFVRRSSEDPRSGLLVVQNWFEEFKKR